MNPKIRKAREEREKNRQKIQELQGRNKELDKQIADMENIEIVGLVRAQGYTLEKFAELIRQVNTPVQGDNNGETEGSAYNEN